VGGHWGNRRVPLVVTAAGISGAGAPMERLLRLRCGARVHTKSAGIVSCRLRPRSCSRLRLRDGCPVPAKWVPNMSAFVVAATSRSPCRVARAMLGSTSPRAVHSGCRHWIGWCNTSPVITQRVDDDPHTHVPWRMPRRSGELDVRGEGRVCCHQVDQPGIDHRPHRVRESGRMQGTGPATGAPLPRLTQPTEGSTDRDQ
jgi:hypothetical protein